MAASGWLACLAVPVWLLWITGIGYAQKKHCIEGTTDQPSAVTAEELQTCTEVPAAWAPARGLKFGTDQLYGGYWVASLILAAIFGAGGEHGRPVCAQASSETQPC